MMYLEETAGGSILAGVVIVVGLAWSLWLAGWLRRVELRHVATPAVERLGLSFGREGWRGRVKAAGVVEGVPVEIVWGRAVRARVVGGRWVAVPAHDVDGTVRGLAREGAAST
jgi:hypothetical protein